jgi:putative glutamine amidotransferase
VRGVWSGSRRTLRIQVPLLPSQPAPVPTRPAVAVTATTEPIRGVVRVRANASYASCLVAAGLRPYVLPVMAAADADAMLDGMHGLVLTGGEDVDPIHYAAAAHPQLGEIHPGRDEFEIALVRAARARKLPTLAICRGIQVVNVALGGSLIQDIPSEWSGALNHDGATARDERVHPVVVDAGSALARALGAQKLPVNSFHHQAVSVVAEAFRVVATAPDGIVEGIESTDAAWWMLGVQWHPEELTTGPEPWDRRLFAAFAAACERGAP